MSTADPQQLVHLSIGGDSEYESADFDGTHRHTGRRFAPGAKAQCIGLGVIILVVIALVGGVLAWVVLKPHPGGGGGNGGGGAGGKHCAQDDGTNCIDCHDGYSLFGTDQCFYGCHTDLVFDVVNATQKGLNMDDTTLHYCPDNMPFHWPNTDSPVASIRMFKSWQRDWDEGYVDKEAAWHDIARYLHKSGAKVFVGTQVSCSKEDDDKDWEDVKKMMEIFGPEHIMGLAVGNEMELLYQKDYIEDIWVECMTDVWTDKYFLNTFHNRIHDMDSLDNSSSDFKYSSIPVTSVFGGTIFSDWPFQQRGVAENVFPRPLTGLVLDFLNNVTIDFGRRWVWTLNIYPYFEPGNWMDPDQVHCQGSLARASCFTPASGNPQDCAFTNLVAGMRDRMAIENFNAAGARWGKLWIGETGWSFPKAATLHSPVQYCEEFSSEQSFQRYFRNFLSWDMEMTGDYVGQGPEFVFWFTMRDSANFGIVEGFGLIGNGDPTTYCTNTTCKLQEQNFFTTTLPYTGTSTTTIATKTATTTAAATTATTTAAATTPTTIRRSSTTTTTTTATTMTTIMSTLATTTTTTTSARKPRVAGMIL